MIVTCPECDTSFQLDESRVPQKGIRVRCSRCKHAFHLAHPSASRSEAIDAVASEAASSGSTSVPSVTQDLTSPPVRSSSPEDSGQEMFDGDEINNEDDAEWEFNEDVPVAEPGASEQAEEGDEPSVAEPESPLAAETDAPVVADSSGDTGSGLDLATDDAGGSLELDTGDAGDGPVETSAARHAGASSQIGEESAGATDFGTVDDFSSLMEDDVSETEAFDDEDDTDSLRAQASEQAGRYAAAGASDELGDPESWDFFDDESPSAPPPSSSAAGGGVPLGRIALTSPGATSPAFEAGTSHDVDGDGLLGGESRIQHVLESAGRLVGWTIVIVAFGLGLVSGLWTTAESFVAGERTTALGPVEAVDMRAHWVDTARAGRLLVVTGGLRNLGRAPTTLTGPIEIALLDRLGAPITAEPVALGLALAERQIRELPIEVLGRQRARAVHQLLTASIPAGGQLPFQAVVFEPPSDGLRFVVRVAEGGRVSLPMPSVGADVDASGEVDAAAELDAGTGEPAPDGVVHDEGGIVPEADGGPASPATNAAPGSAPGADGVYGDDPGLGLQDL